MSIISFEEKMKKEQELEEKEFQQSLQNSFARTIENFREKGMEDNFDALFDSMFSRLQKIVESPEMEGMIEREQEEKKRFYERYADVFKVIPLSNVARIQHLATAMLNLVPTMFHGEWKTRFDIYMDFSYFHYDEFDPVCSKLEKKYGKPDYPFEFEPMDADALEAALKDCLNKIITLSSKEEDSNIMDILYQDARLFELDGLLTDMFIEEQKERENNEEGT